MSADWRELEAQRCAAEPDPRVVDWNCSHCPRASLMPQRGHALTEAQRRWVAFAARGPARDQFGRWARSGVS